MSDLNRAIEIAAFAHRGQVDKGGAPYILHPLRVMLAMDTDEERMVAVLHDALEDGPSSVPQAIGTAWFPAQVVEAIGDLTRRDGETYGAFIERVKANPLARKVKIADMRDNMDLSRIPNPTDKDRERVAKYARYICVLTSA
jgi:(p)ppGpp synthase/HD superfamily hydrolase